MAATHRVEIRKRLGLADWSNDWLIEAVDMDDAVATATALIEFERRCHFNVVLFEYARVSQNNPLTRVFRHVPINLTGYQDATGGDQLPLFNTVRIDLQTADSDPGRKYFRLPVMEGWQTNGALNGAQVSAINALITTYLIGSVAGDNIYTPKGHQVTGAQVYPFIQMRQMHRRHKKKAAPTG